MPFRPSSKQLQSTPVIQDFNDVMSDIVKLSTQLVAEVDALVKKRHQEARQKLDEFCQRHPELYVQRIQIGHIAPIHYYMYDTSYNRPMRLKFTLKHPDKTSFVVSLETQKLLKTPRFKDDQYAVAVLLGAFDQFSLLRLDVQSHTFRMGKLFKSVLKAVMQLIGHKKESSTSDTTPTV